jgi:hypothetical protein
MSVRHRSAQGGRTRLRAAVPILIIMSVASLSGAQIASAEPPPTATVMTADQARRSGSVIGVVRHVEGGGGEVVELQLPPPRIAVASIPPVERARRVNGRLLDTSSTGAIAIAEGVGDPEAGLRIGFPDGSQVRSGVPGVAGASFAPNGSWLAAVDARGRLWRVESATGVATALAAGPYTGSLRFTRSGDLLLVEAASVEAPFASRVVRFAPVTRRVTPVEGEDGFVFSASELADGSIAITAHVFGGGVEVRRVKNGSSATLARLHPSAIDATIDENGSRIAYTVAGAVYLHDVARGSARALGDGEMPRLAPDGSSLLVICGSGSVLLAADGSVLDRFSTAAVGWSKCGGRCRP